MSVAGKYELESSDNFDNYLKAAEVNIMKRAAAAAARPTVEISVVDGVYTIKTFSVFKNTTIVFKLGEEFDEETADGRKCKTTVTLEDNKLVQIQRIDPTESSTVREFTAAGMTATFTCNGVVATRTYKRVA